ncbi:MAG TPA: N-acetyl-gamma-glutamyl-phosphate reductase [Cyclobacteriaceae bacterium]|nr:N-acetyl-gamma-glutamyl-phosphate reductase [Cyclobacteriaceae bacterium]HMV08713.1 N-acetyl-gamma-glutamyl-phosphate reductase [Cyclobacteriaceae bacterium]HMV90049.1 N-acetyl-gamma-glutamyl-phosphate reductase [Cyclobacteriaceae bacterium]HMW99858.1 N-acetyl-gamma-glutamyl-phosphate reductase [Cyclobacteriaceae bacterium]HMX49279.1 N-acetyl-gamma-glutamyl-phosphate reductase [Cyclobacteriaceae bacterium]
MKEKITVGVIGGAGYTGGEAIRLLINHPNAELKFVHSRSNAGNLLSDVHADLTGDTDLRFTDSLQNADVVFLCLGHGESKKFLQENVLADSVKIIDLSHDFRLGDTAGNRKFVYGLPELNKDAIKTASNIANPGCFATAIELGLLPLAKLGLLKDVYTTGITGSTGAGQKLQDTTHFTWRANNISAYKTLAHQHLKEITQSVKQLQPAFSGSINFVPWRGDFTRGIFVSSIITTDKSLEELVSIYTGFYKDHPFTVVSKQTLDLKQVVNTNKCVISLEKEGDKLVVHSAIDNLLKGASGQAVQNMNIMFGLGETAGLKLKSGVF